MLAPNRPHVSPALTLSPLLRPHLPMLTLALLCVIVVLGLVIYHQSGRGERQQRARQRRGEAGERDAVALLERAGYQVVAEQHEGAFELHVDGEPRRYRLRADLLVRRRRDGRLLIAEVKTGEIAPLLTHGPTRRQLLEYALAFPQGVSGVLLVAPELDEVHEVAFPVLSGLRRALVPPWAWFLLGAASAALLTLHTLGRLRGP